MVLERECFYVKLAQHPADFYFCPGESSLNVTLAWRQQVALFG